VTSPTIPAHNQLKRELGVTDAVVVGLGAMIGAGVFVAFGPAARAAGSGLIVGLVIAAGVAYCNAIASARLAALYPESGGTYVYGRRRLGDFWGYLAGWAFVVGKTASCAAIALTVGSYVWSAHAHAVAVVAVLSVTALNYFGVQKAAWVTRVIVAFTIGVLILVVVFSLIGASSGRADLGTASTWSVRGILQAAGLLFFAFAGYARIATLGEEVREPQTTIPRAIPIALGITLAVYAAVAVASLLVLGPERLGHASAPLVDAVRTADFGGFAPVVRVAAACAAFGSLLALVLGVSRTSFAMARDGHLPRVLAAVHPRYRVPYRTELLLGIVVAVLAAFTDVRSAIGFSSFGVLTYYGIANASAFTLHADEHRPWRPLPIAGVLGCAILAFSLPAGSVIAGLAVLCAGAVLFGVRRLFANRGRIANARSGHT
jgi:basic amino acid/polyamine antiporter, APA family